MHPVYTEYLSLRPKFHPVSLYDQPFSRYKIVENRKCTQWPHHVSVKSTLCTLNTHFRGQNLTPFRSTTIRCQDTGFSKIGNAPIDPRMTFSTEVSKVPCAHWTLTPEAKISLLFALRSLVFHVTEVFGFPIGYNGEIKKFVKNRNSKFQKAKTVLLWGPMRRNFG